VGRAFPVAAQLHGSLLCQVSWLGSCAAGWRQAPRCIAGAARLECHWCAVEVLEQEVDAPDEMALEIADGFFLGFAASALCGGVDRRLRVVADLCQSEHVDRVVELPVAARVQAMAVGAPGADRDRRACPEPGELRVAGEPIDPGDLADQLRGDQRPDARLGE
jgi:hypothetical protein